MAGSAWDGYGDRAANEAIGLKTRSEHGMITGAMTTVSTDTKQQLDVGVVICTTSAARRRMLDDLVASIAAGSKHPAEISIVVDRNPELLADLAAVNWPIPAKVVPSDGSGLAAARNTGWRSVRAPLVAFIDDDGLASATWLEELLEAARRHHADIVGGRIEPRWTAGEPRWYSRRLGWVVGCSYDGLPESPAEVRNVIGCNMLMSRDLLERLGGFETTLGRSGVGLDGCEETELCIRAGRAGARVILIPGAGVEQVLPESRGSLRVAIRRGWHEGRSKRRLVNLHGRVLWVESRYAFAVVGDALARLRRGVFGLNGSELLRAVALVAVLGSTTASYLFHGVSVGRGAAPPRPAQGQP